MDGTCRLAKDRAMDFNLFPTFPWITFFKFTLSTLAVLQHVGIFMARNKPRARIISQMNWNHCRKLSKRRRADTSVQCICQLMKKDVLSRVTTRRNWNTWSYSRGILYADCCSVVCSWGEDVWAATIAIHFGLFYTEAQIVNMLRALLYTSYSLYGGVTRRGCQLEWQQRRNYQNLSTLLALL